MRSPLLAGSLTLSLLLCPPDPASAQVGVEIDLPTVDIGLDVPDYPELEVVPESPVYYDPRGYSNYFSMTAFIGSIAATTGT